MKSKIYTGLLLFIMCFTNVVKAQSPLYSGIPVSDQGNANNIGNANTSRNVAVDENGNIYVAFVGSQGIRVAKSVDRGQSYLPSIPISTFSNTEPEIAVGQNGLIFIAWIENGTIYYSRSTDAGSNFSTPRVVGNGFAAVHMTIYGSNIYLIDQNGSNSYYNNNNGAGGFTRTQPGGSYAFSDILTDQDGVVYVPTDDPTLYLFTSINNGSSYTEINIFPSEQVFYSSYALSDGPCGTYIFVGGGENFGNSSEGFKIDVNTGDAFPITLGVNENTVQGRTLYADNQGTLIDGYRSNAGNLIMRVSPDQGISFNPPIIVASGTSHNITRNPLTDDVVVVYATNGQIFTNVYADILKSVKIVPPTPPLSFCSGTSFGLDYILEGSFSTNTVIEAFLSDENGNFVNSILIGSNTSNTNGTISCNLPNGIAASSNYQIQLRITADCLQSSSIPLELGGNTTITGDLNLCIGTSTRLTGGGNPNIVTPWTSSNTNVASVNSSGVVTAITAGTTQISYIDENDCTATETLIVNDFPSIAGDFFVCLDETSQFTGSGTPSASNPWSISDVNIATVDVNGLVTALNPGSTTINYTDINGCSIAESITVNQNLSILGDFNLCEGNLTTLSGSGISNSSNPWQIIDTSIASVSNTGELSGINAGNTQVIYTDANGCSVSENITVSELPTISGTFNTCVGSSITIIGSGIPDSTNAWLSSDNSIATINNRGVITGINVGSVLITYKNDAGCQATQQVDITSGAIISGNTELCEFEQLQLTGSGNPNANNPWFSSDASVARINNTGLITGLQSGTTDITYVDSNGCDATTTVIVNSLPEVDLEEQYVLCRDASNNIISRPIIQTFLDESSFEFVWSLNGVIFPTQTNSQLTAESFGQYRVEIIDRVTGCSDIFETTVIESTSPVITARVTSPLFSDNATVEVTAQGSGNYEFRLDDSNWQTNGTFSNIYHGVRTITVRDLNGCASSIAEVLILSYPKFFTPNDDNYHDTWNINSLTSELEASIYIFDRYGKLIKQLRPGQYGWDGTFNGNPLPSGDYWFTVNFIDPNTQREESFSSHFALKR